MDEPLYRRVGDYLRDGIARGTWPPGTPIPSEKALAGHFSIARMTARQAVDCLIREGLVARVQGRGTFVTLSRVERELTRMRGFSEDMRTQGMAPSSRLLAREVIPAPATVSEHLGLGKREAVIFLRRVRLADGTPMALETSYLHYELCRPVLEADLEAGSLYTFLQDTVAMKLHCASRELRAALPAPAEAALLEMPRKCPVLVAAQTTYIQQDGRDVPAIFGHTLYRGDRYSFRLEIPR